MYCALISGTCEATGGAGLPEGGNAGDVLTNSGEGEAEWLAPFAAVSGGRATLPFDLVSVAGPYTRETAERTPFVSAGTQTLTFVPLGASATTISRKVIIECFARNNDGSKLQTLDAARRIKRVGGTPTLVVSGTDIADDTDALGATFTIELFYDAPTTSWYLRVRCTMPGNGSAGVAVRELF